MGLLTSMPESGMREIEGIALPILGHMKGYTFGTSESVTYAVDNTGSPELG
jgi:hypothetical protein